MSLPMTHNAHEIYRYKSDLTARAVPPVFPHIPYSIGSIPSPSMAARISISQYCLRSNPPPLYILLWSRLACSDPDLASL